MHHEEMVWRDAAVETVLDLREQHVGTGQGESVPVETSSGRTLVEAVEATAPSPRTDIATMDGYAFDATDAYPLTLREEAVRPSDEPPSLAPGEAIAIATGAPLPPEANAVLKREESTVADGELRGASIDPGTYTYQRGSNVADGERLFEPGERLSPKDAILLGDLGRDTVQVAEQFSVGILATGSEIHAGRQEDLDSAMLGGLVRSWGHEATYEGTVPDEYETIATTIDRLADRYDVVLTSGGTSVGEEDHVVPALRDRGTVHFHRVRLRPGKPIVAATIGDGDAVAFGIPGKPVGAHTVATLVVRPFFTGETGLPTTSVTVPVALSLGPEGFEYAIPVTVADGRATPLGHPTSNVSIYDDVFDPSVLSSATRATRADGVVVTREPIQAGQSVEMIPYPVLE
jgi:molybdopterin molybdotransferase